MLYISVKAQTDTIVYHVLLKNGNSLYCQFLAIEKDNYITVKKDGGGIQFFQWQEIKEYTPTILSFNSKDFDEIKRKEEKQRKYAGWENCYVIKGNGDTIRGKVEYNSDYTTPGESSSSTITIVDGLGVESTLKPEDFRYLIVMDRDTTKYLSFAPGEVGYRKIFKIIIDGKCKLLQNHYTNHNAGGLYGTTSFAGQMGVASGFSFRPSKDIDEDRFYLLYQNKWFNVKKVEGFNVTFDFHDDCYKILFDCPELVTSLQMPNSKMDDIREIVNEYNNCLEKNK